MDWGYFDRFNEVIDQYMPIQGEGNTLATQTVTAVNKLIYKWYNDGDVYDNTHMMQGWANNLSSYANWLVKYTPTMILYAIEDCENGVQYEDILKELADFLLDKDRLAEMDKKPKQGTIYKCDGPFEFVDYDEDDEDEDDE